MPILKSVAIEDENEFGVIESWPTSAEDAMDLDMLMMNGCVLSIFRNDPNFI